jgi:hypothetical protein
LAFLPEVQLDPETARRAGHGVPVPGAADGPVRLTDPSGLIGLAEPLPEGELLRPVVVLRPSCGG